MRSVAVGDIDSVSTAITVRLFQAVSVASPVLVTRRGAYVPVLHPVAVVVGVLLAVSNAVSVSFSELRVPNAVSVPVRLFHAVTQSVSVLVRFIHLVTQPVLVSGARF